MDELTLDGKKYVSSKRAAEITGYAKDYIGQLCREGRVEARQVGRNWYVLERSLREHRFGTNVTATADAESEETAAHSALSPALVTWDTPTYSSEHTSVLPPLKVAEAESHAVETLVEAMEEVAATSADPEDSQSPSVLERNAPSRPTDVIVEEMQSAWKDWFSHKPMQAQVEPKGPEEWHINTSEPLETTYSDAQTIQTTEATPQSQNLSEEVSVPITRTGSPNNLVREANVSFDIPRQEPKDAPHSIYEEQFATEQVVYRDTSTATEDSPIARRVEEYEESARIIHERVITRTNNRRGSRVLSTLFIVIALGAVLVAFIGSGYLNISSIRDLQNIKQIQYISGESSFTRAS